VRAQDLSIAAFFGTWRGSALSESAVSVYFRLTERDLDVVVGPSGNGFTITWTTVLRQSGDPNNPTVKRRSTTLNFIASAQPNVWRAVNSGDPVAGQPAIWARIKGKTLTINSMVVNSDGGFEMQVYDRTLSGLGMELEFTRVEDGEPVRTAKGRLVKHAN
jgi:hypothetical protein